MKKGKSFLGKEGGRPFVARDGALIFELFRSSNIAPKNISVASGHLKPKQKALPHYHKISEEVYYIISGSGRCRVGDSVEKIKKREAVYIPVNAVHALENTNRTKTMKVLAISSPPYQDSDMFFV